MMVRCVVSQHTHTPPPPTDAFTLSPIAETSSVVSGLAAPGPASTRERRLSEDISTVADFVATLDAAMNSLLGVPLSVAGCYRGGCCGESSHGCCDCDIDEAECTASGDDWDVKPIWSTGCLGICSNSGTCTQRRMLPAVRALEETMHVARALENSGCIVESSAIKYDALDSVCTEAFTDDQLAGASFCYRFQTTISAPTSTFSDGGCEVNAAVELATDELEDGGFDAVIGPVAGIVEVFVPTNSPTEGPTSDNSETDLPTSDNSETEEPI